MEKRSGGWFGALMTAGAAVGIALTPMPGGSDQTLVAAGVQAVRNAADAIRARSPGLRTRADLVKTKLHRASRPRVARALPRVRQPAALPAALLAAPPAPLPLVFESSDLAPAVAPLFAGPAPFLEQVAAPCPCLFSFVPPIGGGGGLVIGGGGGGGGVVPPPPGPPPAVPEPSQWIAMILGFAILGSAWRRRRAILARLKQIPLLVFMRVPLLAHVRAG